ncbi:MAG: 6-phosphogluconolactonase [Prolixibacteraceae bacterium]|jgi:6-phosphogluconolactonase|nr:6-phosphogluconolactonase [Prolixibacteraceae bacterium]
MQPNIITFENTAQIAEEFASTLNKLIANSKGKEVHIALSGGSTPKAIFKYLNEKYGNKLAHPNLHFWWGDDRCVPPTHDDSNYKWANNLWLKPAGFAAQKIHRVMGENAPQAEAERYSREIQKNVERVNGLPAFDLVLLGLGEDGHTASIFPNQMELLNASTLCEVAVQPQSGQKRISFTGKLINNARHVVFLSTGNAKAQKVNEVLKKQNQALPATHISPAKGTLSWWLDAESARLIK